MKTSQILSEIGAHADKADKPVLRRFLLDCSTVNQWRAFVRCDQVRYGALSFETHRKWTPLPELRALLDFPAHD